MARGLTTLMPRLGHVKVVRQWAGPYDVSPDGDPIVGELPGVPGFYVVCGFGGHGFMMAPVVARHYAGFLRGDSPHPFFQAWRASRFSEGGPGGGHREEMIIG
jgi:sarcosine oxidase subunit beta